MVILKRVSSTCNNVTWISGRMPKDMYSHEHPDAPKLKARSFRKVRYEEEEEGGEEDEGEEREGDVGG